jgi:adenylate cyclase
VSDEKQTIRSRFKSFWQGAWAKAPGIIGGIAIATSLGLGLQYTPFGDSLRFKSYDLPFQWRPWIIPNEVVMIYMDDASYQELDQKYTKVWDRSLHSALIKRLGEKGAKAIVFDVIFSDPSPDARKDEQFADAMRTFGNVIVAADWTIKYNAKNKPEQFFALPLQVFKESVLDIGASTLFPENGEFVREYKPTIEAKEKENTTNSEALVTAIALDQSFRQKTNLISQHFWLNYYCPEINLASVSYFRAVANNDTNVPPDFFSNKVVFVGAKLQTHLAAERKDEYSTPFSYLPDNKWMAGVSIHATAFMNLIRGDYLRKMDWRWETLMIVVCGVVYGGGLVLLPPIWALLIGLLSIPPIVFADYHAFTQHFYWFNWLLLAGLQIPVAIGWSVTYNSVRLHVERKLFEQSLGLYLSPKLVKKFADNPALRQPGAKKQLLTILFTDIAGFTTISEGMDPDELARLMNAYFQGAVQHCIFATEGTVVKYIGDAIFAFWNAPDPQADHAFRGCDAALRFCSLPSQSVNGSELITRLGLHTGEANVGNFGSDQRFDYTAIGENINLSSRMEGLNKYLGTRVLITGDTFREVGSRLVTRYLGLFRLKGFEKAVAVYELITFPDKEADSRELRERFAAALNKFAQRQFADAETAFRRVQEIAPQDGPSEFYLEQIEELRATELPPDWKGEITLKDK